MELNLEQINNSQLISAMIWLGLTGCGHIVGPFFLQPGERLTSQKYKSLLIHKVLPELEGLYEPQVFQHLIFQQDGAPSHRARTVMNYLDSKFNGKILAQNCVRGEPWAPNSPDMSPMDFFVFGYLKR